MNAEPVALCAMALAFEMEHELPEMYVVLENTPKTQCT